MELRQLEMFVAVAEERQFTRAAKRCHIGQSALSTAIRTLERDLGVTLFDRTTRRVELTPAGVSLLEEGRRTLDAAHTARVSVRHASPAPTGRLAVGGVTASGSFDQPKALARFRLGHPGVDISYVRAPSGVLIDDVGRGRLDAAIVTLGRTVPQGLEAVVLLTEPVVLLCRDDHRLASRDQIDMTELLHEEFIAPPRGSFAGNWFTDQFEPVLPRPPVSVEVNDVAAMLELVASGLGIALLPQSSAAGYSRIRAVRLTGNAHGRTLGIVTKPLAHASAELRSFVTTVVSTAA